MKLQLDLRTTAKGTFVHGNSGAVFSGRDAFGFTLVELLVVIAIVAILAGLALPALSRAKALGLATRCRSNLHQAQLGLELYLADNNQRFPLLVNPEGVAWRDLLQRYVTARNVMDCPIPEDRVPTTNWPPTLVQVPSPYGYNCRGTAPESVVANLGLGEPYGLDVEQDPYIKYITESRVKTPGNMISITDATVFFHVAMPFRPDYLAAGRHLGRANVAFCDGHIESGKETKWRGPAPQQNSHWNNDGQTHFLQ